MRAVESRRDDRWFDDPYAQRFLDAVQWESDLPDPDSVEDPMWRAIIRSCVVRTRFLDELLATVTTPQVVILGAGLDSRAFRLEWPSGTRLWELDQPDVLAFKDRVLAGDDPRCERRTVGVDLLADWPAALAAAGHDPEAATTWVAEGLVMYFEPEGVDTLVRVMTDRSPAGSRLAMTLKAATATPERMEGLWRSQAPDDPVRWLAGHGWTATLADWGALAAGWGRPHWRSRSKPGLVDAVRTLDP
jgi:methyltransferase (TIGR00027 family)